MVVSVSALNVVEPTLSSELRSTLLPSLIVRVFVAVFQLSDCVTEEISAGSKVNTPVTLL